MSDSTSSKYLESKVLTASQPQLHLMMLEGAVRFGQKAAELWGKDDQALAVEELLGRLMDIVEELTLCTSGQKNEISQQLEEQYAFVYRELALCRVNQDLPQLKRCLELLDYQRETWRKVCEQLEASTSATSPQPKIPVDLAPPPTESSFSLDA